MGRERIACSKRHPNGSGISKEEDAKAIPGNDTWAEKRLYSETECKLGRWSNIR